MMTSVQLSEVTREHVTRIKSWLADPEVSDLWYGNSDDGTPIHIGYSLNSVLKVDQTEWDQIFHSTERKFYSVHTISDGHIGEAQIVIESALNEAQLFVIVGRKDLWLQHHGSSAMLHLLELSFTTYGLHRVWVDVPDYNLHAIHMCERLGFMLEGHLRSTHLKNDKWHDSRVMGMLESEYARRRTALHRDATP